MKKNLKILYDLKQLYSFINKNMGYILDIVILM